MTSYGSSISQTSHLLCFEGSDEGRTTTRFPSSSSLSPPFLIFRDFDPDRFEVRGILAAPVSEPHLFPSLISSLFVLLLPLLDARSILLTSDSD